MSRIFALIILMSLPFAAPAARADAMADALDLMRAEKWTEARNRAARQSDVAQDVIEWHRLRAGMGSSEDVVRFLRDRSDWPGLQLLRRKSEPVMASADAATIRAYYNGAHPQTAEGALSLGRALIANGQRSDGEIEIILAWRTMAMGRSVQDVFLSNYADLLKDHHAQRLSHLLWQGHTVSAGRMLGLVSDDQRALAEARIALQKRAPGVDAKITAIPAALKSDPGLAYDRFAWRDKKGRRDAAVDLLLERSTSATALGEPENWLRRRRDFARQAMRDKEYDRAYRLAAHHFAPPEAGYGYSDCEWLAGYIALRFLNDPEIAVLHFQRFLDSVETPISIGRGGYWLGQAYAALGEVEKAHDAFARGAAYQTSFYGLLAAESLGRPFAPDLAKPPALPDWRQAAFLESSVLEAGLLLIRAGDLVLAERFLTHLTEDLTEVEARQLGQMLTEMKQPHLAVMVSKRAARAGIELKGAYFPLHDVANKDLPMAREMTLAIARRESEFDPVVISHAGARGLMQVMPATAKLVAGELGILANHSTVRLTNDWAYNARLGANYLAGLAAEFRGNVVMMAAGYNAGPQRPIAWMNRYGDPRTGTPDIIDWIEHIPFNETRNYVMRVTESLPVYRARLGKEPLPIPFSQELKGETLIRYAP